MRRRRLCLLTTLTLLGGCGGMKQYALPGDFEAQAESELKHVPKGMNAVVTLTSGKVVRGDVLDVTPEAIILGRHTNYGYRENTYLAEDIERIESEKPPTAGQAILGVVVFLGALAGAMTIAFMINPPFG